MKTPQRSARRGAAGKAKPKAAGRSRKGKATASTESARPNATGKPKPKATAPAKSKPKPKAAAPAKSKPKPKAAAPAKPKPQPKATAPARSQSKPKAIAKSKAAAHPTKPAPRVVRPKVAQRPSQAGSVSNKSALRRADKRVAKQNSTPRNGAAAPKGTVRVNDSSPQVVKKQSAALERAKRATEARATRHGVRLPEVPHERPGPRMENILQVEIAPWKREDLNDEEAQLRELKSIPVRNMYDTEEARRRLVDRPPTSGKRRLTKTKSTTSSSS